MQGSISQGINSTFWAYRNTRLLHAAVCRVAENLGYNNSVLMKQSNIIVYI